LSHRATFKGVWYRKSINVNTSIVKEMAYIARSNR
jgi:hypothetical protein